MNKTFDFSGYVRFNRQTPFDFRRNSSIGCGGCAEIAFYPQTVAELTDLLFRLNKEGIPSLILGNLTNVLPSDEGFKGAIISTKRLDGIRIGENVFVQAGVTSATFLRACRQVGKSGGEFLSGIPCTLGGALYMNAGASGKYIAEIVDRVLVLRQGKQLVLSVEECQYAYKKSIFMENKDVILGAWLHLENATNKEIDLCMQEYLQRRLHLPKGQSMGCVFKNPVGAYAGDLIERTGLKGFRIRGAKISEEHANFVLNAGGATAKDIRAVIAVAKNAVKAQYGIILEEEIQYI